MVEESTDEQVFLVAPSYKSMQPNGVGSLISEYLLANIWKGRNFQGVTCVGQLCPAGRLSLGPDLGDKSESLNVSCSRLCVDTSHSTQPFLHP